MENQTKKEVTFLAFFTAEVIALLVVFISTFSIFFYIARDVFVKKDHQLDTWAFQAVEAIASEPVTRFFTFVTFFGSKNFFIAVPVFLILFFLFFKKWRWFSVYILVVTLGSVLLNQYFKNNFLRPRPDTALYFQNGFSFPSGHSMIGASFYGILFYLIYKNVKSTWVKWISGIILIGWQLLVAFSRVYLNVHYATDVLAGLALGIFWLFLATLLVHYLENYYHRRVEKRKKKQEANNT